LFGITIIFLLEIVLKAPVKPLVTTVVNYKCADRLVLTGMYERQIVTQEYKKV